MSNEETTEVTNDQQMDTTQLNTDTSDTKGAVLSASESHSDQLGDTGETHNEIQESTDTSTTESTDRVELTPEQQEAFNKAYFEAKQKEREAEALRKELEALKASKSAPQTSNTAPKQLEDFDYDEDAYRDYMIDQKVEQKLREKEELTSQQRREAEAKSSIEAVQQSFNEKASDFAQENPDYQKVIEQYGSQVQYSKAVSDAVLELGPELDYHLLSNPVLADKLSNMSDMQAMIEIGKISTNLGKKSTVQRSGAPTPPPVAGNGARSSKDPNSDPDISMTEYYEMESARLAAKMRGE